MTEKTMPEKYKKTFEISYERYLHDRVAQLVGLMKKFMHKYGREEVLELVKEYMDEENTRIIKTNFSGMKIENFGQFKQIFKQMLSMEFYQNTSTYTIVEDSEEKLEYCFTECLWVDVMKQLGFDGENGFQCFCHVDYSMARAFHPNVKLTRSKTLMQGHECCNHSYSWEEPTSDS